MNDETRTDARLVEAALRGDRDAFASLVDRHAGLLEGVCRRALDRWAFGRPSPVEDAVQEAVLLAMLNLDRLRRPDRFGPWLAGIGLNLCRRKLRERSRVPWALDVLAPVFDVPDRSPSPEEAAVARDVSRRVREAVADLPEGQRRAVMLFYLSGLTVAEVAEELGVGGGAVKVRLHDGRAGLRRRLEAMWKEEVMGSTMQAGPVDMRVREVRRRPGTEGQPDDHVVVLEELNGHRELRIWIGAFEATAMAFSLEEQPTTRPWTYRFAQQLLAAAGGAMKEARIERLADRTFFATVVVEAGGVEHLLDTRPSDAINLALLESAPIRVQPALLERRAAGHPSVSNAEYPDGARALVEGHLAEHERTMARLRSR